MKTMWRGTAPTTLILVAILAGGVSARAEEPKPTTAGAGSAEHVIRLTPAELTWTAGPPMLPPGASMAVIEGSFSKSGPFTVRLRFPANYRIPPHWHPVKVTVTVLSGTFNMGFGDACRAMTKLTAEQVHMRTWGVDYRTPPDHRYPAALDDCVAVYRRLLEVEPPERIVVGGQSAGGNLAAALMLRASAWP